MTAHAEDYPSLRSIDQLEGERGEDSVPPAPTAGPPPARVPVAEAERVEVWAEELLRLPAERVLIECAKFAVVHAHADEIPATLRELGRLREISFRAEGEGSGRALDLDEFDAYYLHLILWNREELEIVGAYRLGPTDVILPERGLTGLYTRTCFTYEEGLAQHICPALELGRSFVRPASQKAYTALPLLWKGIGHYILKNPRYKVLFGAVSISKDYSRASRELMAAYLERRHLRPELAGFVHPQSPFEQRAQEWDARALAALDGDVEELSKLVEELEPDHKGVPILIKHYLKLGAEVLGFNVDHAFSDCLDALIRVDLTNTPPRTLERFMGKEEATAFLAYHSKSAEEEKAAAASGEDSGDFWDALRLGTSLTPSEAS